jgi:hypothetical protein
VLRRGDAVTVEREVTVVGEADDYRDGLEEWLEGTGRTRWGSPDAQPPPSSSHPIWAAVLTVVGVFGLIAAAIVHFDPTEPSAATWVWLAIGGVPLLGALGLWGDVLNDRKGR